MAVIFIDGFDKYGPAGFTNNTLLESLLTQSEWTAALTNSSNTINVNQIVAGLSAPGQALSVQLHNQTSPSYVSKTLPANYSRLIGGARFSCNYGQTTPAGVVFLDVTTAQCAITFNLNGTFSLRTGSVTGTAIATSTASVSANSTHYLEWDIAFGSAGAFNVYLDGVSIMSGTGATKTTSNAYANVIQFQSGYGIGVTCILSIDDVYLFDTTGSANNAVLLTSPRIETTYPTADSAVAFAFGAGVLGASGAYQGIIATSAPGANKLFLRKYTPTANCTLNSVSILPQATSLTAKFKAVAYSDSAAAPNTLLSSGTEVVGCTSGTALTGNLVTPQSLTAATPYWIGFITDTSIALAESNTSTAGASAANTYASGAPSTAPAMTSNQPNWVLWGNVSGVAVNWLEVTNNPSLGDYSNVQSTTVSNEDLYTFGSLSIPPTTVYTAAVKALCRRSDTGARTINLQTKSGTTDGTGSASGITPGTSYGWCDSYFDTDPNTGSAWTGTALNAATSGIKIAS